MPQDILQQNIINLLGLQALPDERKISLLDKMTTLIQKRVTLRLIEMVTDKDQDELEKILEQADDQKLSKFLTQKVPSLEEIVLEEIIKFKEEAKEKARALGV